MRVVIVIPARFESRRFPGKPLVELRGSTGIAKSLIRRTWDAAQRVPGIARVVVATDDARIAQHVTGFNGEVLMTSPRARNGTERCAEAAEQLGDQADLIINFQGDAPLTPASFVTGLIDAMAGGTVMATPVLACDAHTFGRFQADRSQGKVGGTTAVFSASMNALYFSKEVLPFADAITEPAEVFHHVGLYAYRPAALRQYMNWPEGRLEKIEGLEQMRFLENDVTIKCVRVDAEGRDFWEVNNAVDIPRVEAALKRAGIE